MKVGTKIIGSSVVGFCWCCVFLSVFAVFVLFFHQLIPPVGCIFSDCTSVDMDKAEEDISIHVGSILPGESKYYKYHFTNHSKFNAKGSIIGADGNRSEYLCANNSPYNQFLPGPCNASDYITPGALFCSDSGALQS